MKDAKKQLDRSPGPCSLLKSQRSSVDNKVDQFGCLPPPAADRDKDLQERIKRFFKNPGFDYVADSAQKKN